MRTTLADARDPNLSNIAQVLQLCPDDTRIRGYLNRAIRQLLPMGNWRGTVVRYRLCVNSSCLTWPRQIETILAFARCNIPGTIRSHWYEFLGYGPGQLGPDEWCGWNQLIDRDLAPGFDDICGEDKKIRVYLDNPSDAGKTILLQGYDENRNWVLTDDGDVNGELITLQSAPTTYVDTDTVWSNWTGAQKQVTKGAVRLYELDTSTGLQRPLAIYEPDETRPQYRRSLVPGLADSVSCCGVPEDCTDKTITVLAKLAFVPLMAETDYLLIQNLDALQDMCQALKKKEDNYVAEALAYQASAVSILERELENFHGAGTSDPIASQNSAIYAPCGVESLL